MKKVNYNGKLIKFIPYITIIESQKKEEYEIGKNEGIPLQNSLKLMGIYSKYYPVFTIEGFCSLIEKEISIKPFVKLVSTPDEGEYFEFFWPVLHISAHGNPTDMKLMDDFRLSWEELGKKLVPINKKCNNFLIMCMSICSGFSAIKAAKIFDNEDLPFNLLCGPTQTVEWGMALLAFLNFYNRLDLIANNNLCALKTIINNSIGEENLFDIYKTGNIEKQWKIEFLIQNIEIIINKAIERNQNRKES